MTSKLPRAHVGTPGGIPDNDPMSFRSRETLVAWLTEFQALGYPVDRTVRIIEQDGADGANTGLVAVELTSGLSAYIQPDDASGSWAITIESQEDAIELSAAAAAQLSAELATVSSLCAFLQARASEADA